MSHVNQSYLTNLIKDLHNAEHELFNPTHKTDDEKLVKLFQQKARQISSLKFNVQKLVELIEKINYQKENPKIKVVGI
jgi:hypothetical protein